MSKDLHDSNITMSLKGVKKIGYAWWNQKKSGVPVTEISVARKRKKCGRSAPLTPTIATPTDQELGLDFGRFSGSSSSEKETEESGSEDP